MQDGPGFTISVPPLSLESLAISDLGFQGQRSGPWLSVSGPTSYPANEGWKPVIAQVPLENHCVP